MTETRPDFAPAIAADLRDPSKYRDWAVVSYMADGRVILVRDLEASLSREQAIALINYGSSLYYHVEMGERPVIVIHAGLIYDLASVPRLLQSLLPRDRLPEASTVHDAIYAHLRYALETGRFTLLDGRRYRRTGDHIFRRHLRTQKPSLHRCRRRIIYYAVRAFGHKPRPS